MNYRLPFGVTLENVDGTYVFLKDNQDAAVPDYIGGEIINKLLSDGLNACLEYIVDNYEVDRCKARTDIEEFVSKLEKHGLVTICDE